MTVLLKYDAACRAVAEAVQVDEVKAIRDKAIALKAYARQSKNRDLETKAAELRLRATRRIGELMGEQKKTVGLAKGGGDQKSKHRGKKNPSGPPTLADAGIDKNLAKEARELASLDDDEFEGIVTETKKAVSKASKSAVNRQTKKQDRADREAELGAKIRALPDKKYGLILADPEWEFETYSEDGQDRAAANHYPVSPLDKIMARDVPSISADACVLGLYATVPMLPQALEVMKAWGFDYKSHLVWVKTRIGTGYWFRNQHELLLIGTKGNVVAPAPGENYPSVLTATNTRHSEKPEAILMMLEKMFPNIPKIELNRRGPAREGWDAWGNEATEIDQERDTNEADIFS